MAEKKYDVKADITVDPKESHRRVERLSNQISDLGNRIKGTTSLTGGLVGQVFALGSAYVGFSALSAAFKGLTNSAITYQSELQRSKIAIATVLSAVQDISYEAAAKTGDTVFAQLREDAIKSVATTKELFQVYQSIVGPIAQAGFGLDKVRKLTNDSVSAASVLGIDLQQTSRDMQMILRGAAGVDVKLFSTLKSVGAIKESTEAWNKKLTAGQRVEKLELALAKFAPAASRFQTSWAGVTSTFRDITENLRSTLFSPVFDVLAKAIGNVNDSILANRERLTSHLKAMGEHMAGSLETMFLRARNNLQYVANHWDQIVNRIKVVADKVHEMAPVLLKAAAAWQAIGMARAAVGGGLQAAGLIGGFLPTIGAAGGGKEIAAKAMAEGAKYDNAGRLRMPDGKFVAGATSASGTGGATALTLGGAAAALAVLTGAALVAQEQWTNLSRIFSAATSGFGGEIMKLASAIWTAAMPVLKAFTQGPMLALAAVFSLVTPALTLLVSGLRLVFETLGSITNAIYDKLKPGFDWMWGALAEFGERLKSIFGPFFDAIGVGPRESAPRGIGKPYDMRQDQWTPSMNREGFGMFPESAYNPATPAVRSTVVNDFRGSKIEVRQDFREADPDRVLVQMFDAIGKSAEYRTQSNYMPTLAGG